VLLVALFALQFVKHSAKFEKITGFIEINNSNLRFCSAHVVDES